MDNTRGRSPSRGNAQHISPQPSPNHYSGDVQGVDPAVQHALTSGKFTQQQQQQFSAPFLNPNQQSVLPSNDNANFYPNANFNQSAFQDNQYAAQNLDPNYNTNAFMFQDNGMSGDISQNFSFQNFDWNQQQNVNPQDLNKISSPPHDHSSPNLLLPETHSSQSHSSQPGSPSSTSGNQFYTPQHSRQASLDPNSARGDSFQRDNFQQHRRAPSDYSDVSSAQHSPNLPHAELNLMDQHSPYLPAQDSTNTFGMDNFTLGDQAQATYRSPRLMPSMDHGQQQGLGLNQDSHLNPSMMQVPDIFGHQQSNYPSIVASNHMRNPSAISEMGQADQYALPAINIEPAPVSRQPSFGPNGELVEGTLSPPSSSRGRNRSKSDVTGLTRPIARSASTGAERTSPSLSNASLTVHSYTPDRARSGSLSRESSPGPVQSGRIDKNRRASTSSMGQNRDYILDLADPNRPNANASGTNARVQKHPATFQCTLCPKRFTRAYNLRSHLRTHTDERPFVCTVCGKAFARQHDRKRHEGLHSGEKKFVCKGELRSQPGQHWGCGRRFARADALGRHFRSEAGRICIKPLLEEEKQERQARALMEQQHQQQAQFAQQGGLQPVPQPLSIGMDPTTGTGGFMLPAALLAQYPALQNIDWSQIQQGDDPGDLSDMGGMGRASFDGSSNNGDYYEDLSEGYESGLDFSNQQGQSNLYGMGS